MVQESGLVFTQEKGALWNKSALSLEIIFPYASLNRD